LPLSEKKNVENVTAGTKRTGSVPMQLARPVRMAATAVVEAEVAAEAEVAVGGKGERARLLCPKPHQNSALDDWSP